MSASSSDSQSAARRQLQELLSTIEQLALSGLPVPQFNAEFVQHVTHGLDAEAGFVLLGTQRQPDSDPQQPDSGDSARHDVDYRVAARCERDGDGTSAIGLLRQDAAHTAVIERVWNDARSTAVLPGEAGNPTQRVLLIVPLTDTQSGQPFGIIELIRLSGIEPLAIENYLRLIERMARQAALFHKVSGLNDGQRHTQAHTQFLQAVHASLDRRRTAYAIVNEGRLLAGCERLSLALWDGHHCELEAVSGQGWFERRSRSVMLLEQLATQVASSQQPLWYGNGTPPPQHLTAAIMEYVDATKAREIVVVPVAQADETTKPDGHGVSTGPRPPLSMLLIAEQFSASAPPRSGRTTANDRPYLSSGSDQRDRA